MNDVFLEKAYHPTAKEELVARGKMICEGNDMAIVKAFYKQWHWATEEDAAKVTTKAVVVHGAEDRLIIPDAGEHLNDMLPNSEFKSIPNASHQVIVLSTDTEVDEKYYDSLQPHIARSYHLDYSEKKKVTEATEGYFWETELAEAGRA